METEVDELMRILTAVNTAGSDLWNKVAKCSSVAGGFLISLYRWGGGREEETFLLVDSQAKPYWFDWYKLIGLLLRLGPSNHSSSCN
jgi:hypothetical protein